jgi:hypothetical protein
MYTFCGGWKGFPPCPSCPLLLANFRILKNKRKKFRCCWRLCCPPCRCQCIWWGSVKVLWATASAGTWKGHGRWCWWVVLRRANNTEDNKVVDHLLTKLSQPLQTCWPWTTTRRGEQDETTMEDVPLLPTPLLPFTQHWEKKEDKRDWWQQHYWLLYHYLVCLIGVHRRGRGGCGQRATSENQNKVIKASFVSIPYFHLREYWIPFFKVLQYLFLVFCGALFTCSAAQNLLALFSPSRCPDYLF